MDFALDDDQTAIVETARRFARDVLLPGYLAREAAGEADRALLREMGGLGLIGADLSSEHGGLGTGGLTVGLIVEELARGDYNVANMVLSGSLMGRIVQDFATAPLAAAALPPVVAGEALLALGLTEPRGGSDAANLQLKARRAGDGYVLNGEKTSISAAAHADAVVLFARTGAEDAGAHGVSAFHVPLDLPGIARTRFDDLGQTIIGRGSLHFDDVRLPARHLLGDEGGGFTQVMRGFDYSRVLLGLTCLGAARASLDETWQYIQEREAFGQPIARFQGVSFPLAEAETHLTAARDLCYRALWLRDSGLPHTAEAAMCKWWPPKIAAQIIHQCLLTHGHYGYTTDLPHQQRWRDVIGIQIGDGTEQIMKMIVTRERIGRMALQY